MKRTTLNYLVDLGLILSFTAVLLTGIMKFPILLRGLARRGFYLPSNEIALVHQWGGAALAAFSLFHLVLHWKWVAFTTRRFLRRGHGSDR
jgi:hypothetical protein